MFDVNTRNGSVVTPKIAGMESIAKIRSVNSTRISTSSSGVAIRRPFSTVKKCLPLKSLDIGTTRRTAFTILL